MADLPTSSILGGYRIEEPIGRGGMGVVYRATQIALQRPVALKLISPDLGNDEQFRARFQRESLLAAAIEHPNVLPVYEAGEAEGRLFIAMRFVDGEDLAARIRREGRLDPATAAEIVTQVAGALDAAHARGLVHRDVKPANVLLSAHDGHAYLTDFGLSKRVDAGSALTKTGTFVGTLDYMPPEQMKSERVDARSDVYALGCVLFHTLAGSPPFPRETEAAKLYAHLHDDPPQLGVSPLDRVIGRAMAKEPEDRYASAGDLARAAAAAADGRRPVLEERSVATGEAAPATAERAPSATRTRATDALPTARTEAPRSRRPLGAAAALGLALLVAGLAAAGVFSGGDDSGDEPPGEGARQPRVSASIPVGREPDGIAVADGSVWVANSRDGTLGRIEASSNRVIGDPVEIGSNPDSVAVARDVVWVTVSGDAEVLRVDARGDRPVPVGRIRVGDAPEGVSIGKQLVWVASAGDGVVHRIDRASPSIVGAPIGVGTTPAGVFVGEGTVWVANAGDGTVTRIDPSTAEVVGAPIPVGREPRAIVEAAGFAWVVNTADGTVSRISTGSGRPEGRPIRVGETPRGIAFGEGAIWVANTGSNTVTRLDPETGEVLGQPIAVGTRPVGIAVGEGAVWVTNLGDDTVTRIDP